MNKIVLVKELASQSPLFFSTKLSFLTNVKFLNQSFFLNQTVRGNGNTRVPRVPTFLRRVSASQSLTSQIFAQRRIEKRNESAARDAEAAGSRARATLIVGAV